MRDPNKKRILEFAEGLSILAKYDEKGFSVQAEHDVLYAGPQEENIQAAEEGEGSKRGSVVSEADAARLVDLGWHIDSETETWAKFS